MRRFFQLQPEEDYSQIHYLTAKCTRLAHEKAVLERQFVMSRERERKLQNDLEAANARLLHQEQTNTELRRRQDQLISMIQQQQEENCCNEELLRQVGSELLCLQSSEVKLEGLVKELHAEAQHRAAVAENLEAQLYVEVQCRAALSESLQVELHRFKDNLMKEREALQRQVSKLKKKAGKLKKSSHAESLLCPLQDSESCDSNITSLDSHAVADLESRVEKSNMLYEELFDQRCGPRFAAALLTMRDIGGSSSLPCDCQARKKSDLKGL
ncbi:hypothetical protein PAMP_023036 [Pampus punctatissimus]